MSFLIASNNSSVARYIIRLVHIFANGDEQLNVFGFDTIKEVRENLVFNAGICERGGMTVRDCVITGTIKTVNAGAIKHRCYVRNSYLAFVASFGGVRTTATVEMQK
ncbi:hypothetical protein LCGC14_2106600 [marine sediment metagenome]|uniref:Uncharacterized protein n=1 Tax=marine sediment metagenome TaxID=412755 RepID=A0A0F9E8L6_9ZZZZ